MATLLDVTLLEHFGTVFIAIMVFILVYGILEITNALKNKGLHAILGIMVAIVFLTSKRAMLMVSTLIPWFIVVGIFIFFLLFLVRIFGISDMTKIIKDPQVYPYILIIGIIIIVFSLTTAFGQDLLSPGESSSDSNPNTNTNYSEANYQEAPASGVVYQNDYPAGVRPISQATVSSDSTTTEDFSVNMINTLKNPKILGTIFVMLVGVFTLFFLTRPI